MYSIAILNDNLNSKNATFGSFEPTLAFNFAMKAALSKHLGSMILVSDFLERGYGTKKCIQQSKSWKCLHLEALMEKENQSVVKKRCKFFKFFFKK
jgi:hypothetical protein